MMEAVLLSLLLCLQWCNSMPPHLYGEIQPQSELFSEDGHKLGQLYEDIDDIKNTQEAQDHQIEILQNDVHGLSHMMEEQSLLLVRMMEREGLVLDNNHDDRQFSHNKNQLRQMELWEDEEGEPIFEESEEMEKEHTPINNKEVHTSAGNEEEHTPKHDEEERIPKHDEEEHIPFHNKEKHTPIDEEEEYIASDDKEEYTPIDDEEAYIPFEDEE